jgi:hypothetical protein
MRNGKLEGMKVGKEVDVEQPFPIFDIGFCYPPKWFIYSCIKDNGIQAIPSLECLRDSFRRSLKSSPG